MAYSKGQMNDYMKRRWKARRELAIAFLGGCCSRCGKASGKLEFDHLDPKTKVATIARASSFSEVRFWAEVKKCQLLCFDCHDKKSDTDGTKQVKIVSKECCGKSFTTDKAYAGHKRWCKGI